MKDHVEANRRNVLRTLGAGVVGGTVLTGTATAGSDDNPDKTIVLDNFSFIPRRASVTLGSDDTAVVRWEHQHEINGNSPPHDVVLFESKGGTELVRSSDGSGEDLWAGDIYEVKFTEDDSSNELVLDEVRDDSSSTDFTGARVDFSDGSAKLHVHCSHHDPGMAGSLTIER